MKIPVIDLFAGPGGLCEGFSRSREVDYRITISIEKDAMAHETLRLRAAYRELMRNPKASELDWYLWDDFVERHPWQTLFSALHGASSKAVRDACFVANQEARQLELGPQNRDMITEEIRNSLLPYQSGRNLPSNTVLIGGPPCQAYSVVGRARNKGQEGYVAEKDNRHFLYLEYLHVISEFKPAVFVMENVKGILSSKVNDGNIFHRILDDLRNPSQLKARKDGNEYVLLPLVEPKSPDTQSPEDFIVKAELFGIPQARHRVIILGIRRDVYDRVKSHPKLQQSKKLSVNHVIDDLPSLSPEVSKRGAGINFNDALSLPIFDQAIGELERSGNKLKNEIACSMKKLRAELRLRKSNPGPGRDRIRFVPGARKKSLLSMNEWYKDRNTNLITNHESRSHMPSDLVRYMFVSTYGKIAGESPRLKDFPKSLLPAHKNVIPEKLTESIFNDRFRVQIGSRYSTTITSHIAKDGHAFIHYNPKQCRSLSVREAARLQTFPDTYVFLGNRTAQYTQVGNAVPPKLANQIADVVASILKQADLL